jgi:hypothetical protein
MYPREKLRVCVPLLATERGGCQRKDECRNKAILILSYHYVMAIQIAIHITVDFRDVRIYF